MLLIGSWKRSGLATSIWDTLPNGSWKQERNKILPVNMWLMSCRPRASVRNQCWRDQWLYRQDKIYKQELGKDSALALSTFTSPSFQCENLERVKVKQSKIFPRGLHARILRYTNAVHGQLQEIEAIFLLLALLVNNLWSHGCWWQLQWLESAFQCVVTNFVHS